MTLDQSQVAMLTPRLKQVALGLAHGKSHKEIATELNVEHSTVQNHVARLYRRFGCRTRSQVVAVLKKAGEMPWLDQLEAVLR